MEDTFYGLFLSGFSPALFFPPGEDLYSVNPGIIID